MRDADEFDLIFRIWSDLLGALIGISIGVVQSLVGANITVIGLSAVVGLAAGEIGCRLGRHKTLSSAQSPLSRYWVVLFLGAIAISGAVVYACHKLNIGMSSGAMVSMAALIVAADLMFGRAAAIGAIAAGLAATLYWIVPPEDSFFIVDFGGAVQLWVAVLIASLAFVMAEIIHKLNFRS